ncbi:tRNA (N6-threonylcarbamoyladenosine(37)-N6)-methyltransferase TrmO [Desulfuromusa kysingii]|uniref:tRNA (N6-threonylcarbamoyladenosine(37)-N6)-methyltransferase TrmO n=1 Tax=Desulfuromusa kysingii TaxID=37625 RepID=UPI000B87DEC4
MNYPLEPIALIHTPFKEKFATPRQPGLVPSVHAQIDFHPGFATPEAIRGLEGFSHLWLIFLFHQNWQKGWQPTVRPPRLGGKQRVGVYASRSPFRPNPVGLSAVKLLDIHVDKGNVSLLVEGADLIDETPILDIKPYIPYSDSIPEAQGGFAEKTPQATLKVEFTEVARQQLQQYLSEAPRLELMIREVLGLDPRPAYRRGTEDSQEYGVRFDNYEIRWKNFQEKLIVDSIEPVNQDLTAY